MNLMRRHRPPRLGAVSESDHLLRPGLRVTIRSTVRSTGARTARSRNEISRRAAQLACPLKSGRERSRGIARARAGGDPTELRPVKTDQVKRLKELCGRPFPDAGEADPARGRLGKLLSSARRALHRPGAKFDVSERVASACWGSTDRRSERRRGGVPAGSSSTAATAIDHGLMCADLQGLRVKAAEEGPALTDGSRRLARAPTTSGPTTSSRIAPTTAGSSACSTSSMSSRVPDDPHRPTAEATDAMS